MKTKLIALLFAMMLVSVACGEISPRMEEEMHTEKTMREISRQVGMPEIDNFFEKRLAKEIFELRDDSKLITYAYTQNLDGQFVYLGQAIGFGLPYSVQYTNPQELFRNVAPLPQADPNGLYMPEGLSATWLLLINEKTGEPEVIYTEPSIVVTQTKLPKRLLAPWSITENY